MQRVVGEHKLTSLQADRTYSLEFSFLVKLVHYFERDFVRSRAVGSMQIIDIDLLQLERSEGALQESTDILIQITMINRSLAREVTTSMVTNLRRVLHVTVWVNLCRHTESTLSNTDLAQELFRRSSSICSSSVDL